MERLLTRRKQADVAKRVIFKDLNARVFVFEFESPDGELMEVEMRALAPDELLDIDMAVATPEAPITDFKTGDNGEVQPVRDYQDKGYKRALTKAGQERMYRQILKAWVDPDIPGDTEAEQLAEIAALPLWALDGLWQAVRRVTEAGVGTLRARTFQPDAAPDDGGV
jgi:hypothetical protein